jgi:hypothetical protein
MVKMAVLDPMQTARVEIAVTARIDPGRVRRGGSIRLRSRSGISSSVRSRGRTIETIKIIERVLKLEDPRRAERRARSVAGDNEDD